MGKIRALKCIGLVLVVAYVLTILLAYKGSYFGNYNVLAFSLVLTLVSLGLCYKGSVLKSYSTLWFALSLILYALLILIFEIKNIEYSHLIYLFAFLPILPSLLLVCLGKFAYIKVIIINLSLALPLLVINILEMALWLKIGVFTVSVLLGLLVSKFFSLDKEKI